jgi:hypothetical protein
VGDFLKRRTIVRLSRSTFEAIAPAAATLAEFEGLPLHAESLNVRREERIHDEGREAAAQANQAVPRREAASRSVARGVRPENRERPNSNSSSDGAKQEPQ